MKKIHINLLELTSEAPLLHDVRPVVKQHSYTPLVVGAVLMVTMLGGTAVYSYKAFQNEDSGLNKTIQSIGRITSDIRGFSMGFQKKLKGEEEDRVNILLLGIGGEGHDGANLSDTIIIASIKPSTNQVALMSIPRDLLVDLPGYGWRKINNAYAFGEMQQSGTGGQYASDVVSKTFNIPVNYYLRIDFDGFKEAVDTLGGLNVVVDHTFTDYKYPTENDKWKVVSFQEGPQMMDGSTALEFARSRHSVMNNEGSDFARSKRQQKIIQAMKDKLLSSDTIFNPGKIVKVYQALSSHIDTNFQSWEMLRGVDLAKNLNTKDMANVTLDDGPQGHLYSQMLNGAYVLQPRDGSFSTINQEFASIFDNATMSAATSAPLRVAVKNGTTVAGLASTTAQTLKDDGYTVISFGNALTKDHTTTTLYDYTNGRAPEKVEALQKTFNATVVKDQYNQELATLGEKPDILIILGGSNTVSTNQ